MLAARHDAGVTKKKKGTRKSVLSSRARRRQERGLDKSVAVLEKTLQKTERSQGSLQTVHARRKPWDDINRKLTAKKPGGSAFGVLDVEGADGGEHGRGGWVSDEDMDAADGAAEDAAQSGVLGDAARTLAGGAAPMASDPSKIPLPPPDDDDEIL